MRRGRSLQATAEAGGAGRCFEADIFFGETEAGCEDPAEGKKKPKRSDCSTQIIVGFRG